MPRSYPESGRDSSGPPLTVAALRFGAIVDHDSYILRNRRVWGRAAPDYADAGRRSWASEDAVWGIWRIPEPQVGLFPPLAGRRVLELGCGTGYVSAWMARRGARPVGLNDSASQLATARRFQGEFDLEFPLLRATFC